MKIEILDKFESTIRYLKEISKECSIDGFTLLQRDSSSGILTIFIDFYRKESEVHMQVIVSYKINWFEKHEFQQQLFEDIIDKHFKRNHTSFLSFIEEYTVERLNNHIDDKCTKRKLFDVYVAWCETNNNGYFETKQSIKKILEDINKADVKTIHGFEYYSKFTLTDEAKLKYANIYLY